MSDQRDIGPDNGKLPPYEEPLDTGPATVGAGEGYSGEEYDAAGQEAWRKRQERHAVPEDGTVIGSGAGAGSGDVGEDFDVDRAGGARPAGTDT